MNWSRAAGLGIGFLADRIFGDPERHHPVAIFGTLASDVEKVTYADTRSAGILAEVLLVGGAVAVGGCLAAVSGRCRGRGAVIDVFTTAAATFTVLGGTTLVREAEEVAACLAAGDLPGAQRQIGRIVGRGTTDLQADEVARATVETVAENTSDAVVAPLFWGAVAGIPGLFGYRAVNTLDAMFGYRSERYRNFGWAAARLDDLANLIPARCTAALVALVRPSRARAVAETVARDAAKHPSPNAGQVEAAFAAALDVSLGGVNTYNGRTEDRGRLGSGRQVAPCDVSGAVRLSRAVGVAAAAGAILISGLFAWRW